MDDNSYTDDNKNAMVPGTSRDTVLMQAATGAPIDDEAELKRRGYMLGSTLGEGSYAKVKLAFSEALQKRIAIKIINKQKAKRDFVEKFLPREISIIKCIHHPNIVEIYDVVHIGYKIYVIMELAGHGDLLQYIKLKGALEERKAKRMFAELTSGIAYLHANGIVHRDLKCENLLLDVNNLIKISDFGFARLYDSTVLSKTYCGSAAYAAPEILQGRPYVCPLYDIWSMGVILYIMVCGSMPFDDSNIKKMIKDQTERKIGYSRSKNLSSDLKELIAKLLEADISKRARVADIVNSKWLRGYGEYFNLQSSTSPAVQSVSYLDQHDDGRVGTATTVSGTSPVNGNSTGVSKRNGVNNEYDDDTTSYSSSGAYYDNSEDVNSEDVGSDEPNSSKTSLTGAAGGRKNGKTTQNISKERDKKVTRKLTAKESNDSQGSTARDGRSGKSGPKKNPANSKHASRVTDAMETSLD